MHSEVQESTSKIASQKVSKPMCSVCSDKSSGFHYGTHACEGCKGFFRRMVTNSILGDSMLRCTGFNKYYCEINIYSRNNCQRCRLQKCFQVGMTRYKTRLGRRTKAVALKLESKISPNPIRSLLSDENLLKLIKRENSFFSNNEIEDEISVNEDVTENPQAKCIKYKAKLYSERNSMCYQKCQTNVDTKNPTSCQLSYDDNYLCKEINFKDSVNDCENNDLMNGMNVNQTRFSHVINELNNSSSKTVKNIQSELANRSFTRYSTDIHQYESLNDSYKFNSNKNAQSKKSQLYVKIKHSAEECQIEKLCKKIRVFRNNNPDSEDYRHFFNCKSTIFALTSYFCHPNLEEMEEYYRTRVQQISFMYNPSLVFIEMNMELTMMAKKIFAFFKRLPDLELFELITMENTDVRKKIIQALYLWLVRFVNLSENIIYNTALTMKIPHSVLVQTPLKNFFNFLFKFAESCNSIFSTEIDDFEISLVSALIVTFPKKEWNNNTKSILQPDNFLKIRFLYCASLYDHMFAEKCVRNHDLTEHRLQKICWLINESDLLIANDMNYIFSYLNW